MFIKIYQNESFHKKWVIIKNVEERIFIVQLYYLIVNLNV